MILQIDQIVIDQVPHVPHVPCRTSRAAAWRELGAGLAEKIQSADATVPEELAMTQVVLCLPPNSRDWQVGLIMTLWRKTARGCKLTAMPIPRDVAQCARVSLMKPIENMEDPGTLAFQVDDTCLMQVLPVERIVLVLQVEEKHTQTRCDSFRCTLRAKSAEALRTAQQEIPPDSKLAKIGADHVPEQKDQKGKKSQKDQKEPAADAAASGASGAVDAVAAVPKSAKQAKDSKISKTDKTGLQAHLKKGFVKAAIGKSKKPKEQIMDPRSFLFSLYFPFCFFFLCFWIFWVAVRFKNNKDKDANSLKSLKALPQNFNRGQRGVALITQEMHKLYRLDREKHPTRPLLTENARVWVRNSEGKRVPGLTWAELVARAPNYFSTKYSKYRGLMFGNAVHGDFVRITKQLSGSPSVRTATRQI